MSKRSDNLLKALKAMSDLLKFEDRVKNELRIEVYEMQPSLSAGILFDLYTEDILTREGSDIVAEFMFTVFKKYDEENPMVIKETIDGETMEYHITSMETLCEFLDDNGYFKWHED